MVNPLLARASAACAFVSLLSGCSALFSRPPHSLPDGGTANPSKRCGGIAYPLADTASVIAGGTYVLTAASREDDSRPYTLVDGQLVRSGEPQTSYQWMRVTGYSVMAVFGLSALYGYYVEARCASLRKEVAEKRAQPPPGVSMTRASPPTTILGFSFKMPPSQAEQACAAKQYEWSRAGAVALCRPKDEAPSGMELQLGFESDSLRQIAVVRRAPADQLTQRYEELYGSIRALYGAPQVERAALAASCQRSLADCLKNGE